MSRAVQRSCRSIGGLRACPAAILLCAVACGGGNDGGGLDAWLRIPGGQYVAGPLPAPSGGPEVVQAFTSRADIAAGSQDRRVQASLQPATAAVAIGLDGDRGHWILPAGPPSAQEPGALTVSSSLSFSPDLPAGDYALIVRPIDAGGRAGQGAALPLRNPAPALPAGALAITLTWDNEADLDLHVVEPGGEGLYWGHVASAAGVIDVDSNQSCTIDGRRTERAFWATAAPAGHYLVRVDTPSLCAEATAHWRLQAQVGDRVVASARGQSIASDTRGAHGRGAGLLALELDVP